MTALNSLFLMQSLHQLRSVYPSVSWTECSWRLSFMNQSDGKPASRAECRPNFGVDKTLMAILTVCNGNVGSCVQACPTSTMVDARDRKQGDTDLLKKVHGTICTYCGVDLQTHDACRREEKQNPLYRRGDYRLAEGCCVWRGDLVSTLLAVMRV